MRSSTKFLISSILLCCLVINCSSITYFERQVPKPGHEKECYDAENDIYYQKGETMIWNKKYCGKKICRGFDTKGRNIIIDHFTCDGVSILPGCHIKANFLLPYPKCCGFMVCPKNDFLPTKEYTNMDYLFN